MAHLISLYSSRHWDFSLEFYMNRSRPPTPPQWWAALAYYQLYPEEIETRLVREQQWTPERVRRELPFAVPRPATS
jgi:hypothetical protein